MTAPQASRDAGLILLRTVGGALAQPVGQSIGGPELFEQCLYDVTAALPATCRAFDAEHIELSDQAADRSVRWHGRKTRLGGRQRRGGGAAPGLLGPLGLG